MPGQVTSPSHKNHQKSISMGDCTMQDRSSFLDHSDASTTTMTTFHRPSRHMSSQGHSLAKPPSFSAGPRPRSSTSTLENPSPQKQLGGGSRDRFITRANFSFVQPGGLAEACGVKTNRVLEYNNAPPMKRKYAPTDFMSLYAAHKPALKTGLTPSRKVSTKPSKVLDAPGIADDFYANILDWSKALDCMAIGLGSAVYCWNPLSSDVTVVTDLDPDNVTGCTVTSVRWSNEDTCLAIATSHGDVQIWDAGSATLVRSMKGRTCERVAALSWTEPILSSGGRNGSIWNHDVRIKNHKVSEMRVHAGEICGLEWRDDARVLASGSNDNTVAIWDARVTSVPKYHIPAHQAAVKALAWCPWQSNLLATGGGTADRQINFWNAASGNCVNTIDAGSQVTNLHWNKEYREIAGTLGYPNNSIAIWSYPNLCKQVEIPAAHEARILNSALTQDSQTLVTCASDENIKFWNLFEATPKMEHHRPFQRLGFESGFAPGRV